MRFREEAWGLAVLAAVAFDAAVAQDASVAPVRSRAEDRADRAHDHAADDRRRARRRRVGDRRAHRQLPPGESRRVRGAVGAHRDLSRLRRRCAVRRRAHVHAARRDHGEHHAPGRLDHAGRLAVRDARSVQHAPRRLLLRLERARRALRRSVSQRLGVLQRLGQHLVRRRAASSRAAGRPSTRSRSSRCRSIRTATRGGSTSRAASRRATRTWRGSRAIGAGIRAPPVS